MKKVTSDNSKSKGHIQTPTKNSEKISNDDYNLKPYDKTLEMINSCEVSSQTEDSKINKISALNEKQKFILFLLLLVILIQQLVIYFFITKSEIWKITSENLPNDLAESELPDFEQDNKDCEDLEFQTEIEEIHEIIDTQPKNTLDEIKFLLSEECKNFNKLESLIDKVEYLQETFKWWPMYEGKILRLNNLYSYQDCEYFIGYSDNSVFKFSIYKDFTKLLKFDRIQKILRSPDNEYFAISSNKLYLINFSKFQSFEIDDYKKSDFVTTLIAFSPDSAYLFYTRSVLNHIMVFSTSTHEKVITFDTQNVIIDQMIPSQSLYHLIVKDVEKQIKIFSIKNKNYIYLCTDLEVRHKLRGYFPELDYFK